MLGYGGHADWRDMSEYVVHLTAAETLTKVLEQRALEPAGPVGTARNLVEVADTQRAVCLSEIPLDQLDRLVERKGEYGLGFRRSFVRGRGGAPVWYLERDTAVAGFFQEMINGAMRGGIEPTDDIWKITPFVDNPGSGDWGRYEFDWEREWRVVGQLTFGNGQVAFLIAPEPAHPELSADWLRRVTTSAPAPPLIDLSWSPDRLQRAFAEYELSAA